jgi:hypothetical protein
MQYLGVLLAAAAAYAFGAVWYMTLSKQWMAAAGVACDENGKPLNTSIAPFILSAVAMVVVAGMMRHIMIMSGLSALIEGLMVGFGLGIFITLPWITINYAYAGRPRMLTYIDGTYAVVGCTLIGVVLSFFL